MIEIVSATRMNSEDFWNHSALGRSLKRLEHDHRLIPKIYFENRRGLPDVYNESLMSADSEIAIFIHDDVWIDDFFLADRVLDAVKFYDVFGVVGNRRRIHLQPSWAFLTIEGLWDAQENLSGSIAHGQKAFGKVGYFGPTPASCELLDGVFIGVRKSALREAKVYFDPEFNFHFYDVDFCIEASRNKLRMGTWPIALTHQSTGGYNQSWLDSYYIFCKKWERVLQKDKTLEVQNSENLMETMKQTPAHDMVNYDLLSLIPLNARSIVEVGCMHGQMAKAYLATHPTAKYVGIDIDPDYAEIAKQFCTETLAADIELLAQDHFDRLFPSDCWIFGDCLEHLRDPWNLLRRIRVQIDPDGCLLACIPNAQHWSVQWRLLSGQFRYEDNGLMDRTHLRWFTRITMLEMFQATGWQVSHGFSRIPATAPMQDVMLDGIRRFALESGSDPELAVNDALPIQYVFKLVPVFN